MMQSITRRVALAAAFIPMAAHADETIPPAPRFAPPAFWPVVTDDPRARIVPSRLPDGSAQGAPLRRFNAPRPAARADNPTRRHVGVDLTARVGDAVIAIADGAAVAFYPFLTARTGETTYALLVQHATCVVLYGEIRREAVGAALVSVGDAIAAGQRLGHVSDTAQLHIETYVSGTRRNVSWRHGDPAPRSALDPTTMLLDLAVHSQT